MAEDSNLLGFSLNWILIGLFLMSMISGYVLLVNNEGKGEIFDEFDWIQNLNFNLTNQLTGKLQDTANINMNLSANYNPELAISAADQSGNAIGINLIDMVTGTWNIMSSIASIIFGNIWTLILSIIFAALFAWVGLYYLVRFIRSGN